MLELVVAATADINPAFPLEPANDICEDDRHRFAVSLAVDTNPRKPIARFQGVVSNRLPSIGISDGMHMAATQKGICVSYL